MIYIVAYLLFDMTSITSKIRNIQSSCQATLFSVTRFLFWVVKLKKLHQQIDRNDLNTEYNQIC